MKLLHLLLPAIAISQITAPALHAQEKAPVPAELQALAESLVNALKSGDQAALAACWHTPEALADARAAAATPAEGKDPAREREKELKRQVKNQEETQRRATQVRALVAKLFGDVSKLALVELDVDDLEEHQPEAPEYDDVSLHLRSADGTLLKIGIDDAVRLGGVWKFRGDLEDDLTIELPELD